MLSSSQRGLGWPALPWKSPWGSDIHCSPFTPSVIPSDTPLHSRVRDLGGFPLPAVFLATARMRSGPGKPLGVPPAGCTSWLELRDGTTSRSLVRGQPPTAHAWGRMRVAGLHYRAGNGSGSSLDHQGRLAGSPWVLLTSLP